jgi:hypothetical protein
MGCCLILRKYGREPKIENFGASNEIHACYLCIYLFLCARTYVRMDGGGAYIDRKTSRLCRQQAAAQMKRNENENET